MTHLSTRVKVISNIKIESWYGAYVSYQLFKLQPLRLLAMCGKEIEQFRDRSRRPVLTFGKLRELRLPAQVQIEAITNYEYYFGIFHDIELIIC